MFTYDRLVISLLCHPEWNEGSEILRLSPWNDTSRKTQNDNFYIFFFFTRLSLIVIRFLKEEKL